MRRKMSSIMWGILFIIMGIGFAGNALLGWHFSIFFPGWWTLFLIIPFGADILEKGFNTSNEIGFFTGLYFLLSQWNIIPSGFFGKLVVPVVLIMIGANMLKKERSHRRKRIGVKLNSDNLGPIGDYAGVFNSKKVEFPGQQFFGCTANAIFGSVDIDLRGAIFEEDVIMDVTSIFGGIEIRVPDNVRVKVSSVPVFGSVRNKATEPAELEAPVLFVNAVCMFGGVDIR